MYVCINNNIYISSSYIYICTSVHIHIINDVWASCIYWDMIGILTGINSVYHDDVTWEWISNHFGDVMGHKGCLGK